MYTSRGMYSTINTANTVWTIVSIILAIVGGLLLYFLFTTKKNEGKFKGFVAWLYSFLRFDKMMIEAMIKVLYLILAVFVTLSSFSVISSSFIGFLLYLVLGNIVLRIVFEFSLIGIQLWKNTQDIKDHLKENKNK